MELIGWLHYKNPNLEPNFEARFSLKGHSKEKAWLEISASNQTDSAEYFCAASQHSASTHLAASQKAGSAITGTCVANIIHLIQKRTLVGRGVH